MYPWSNSLLFGVRTVRTRGLREYNHNHNMQHQHRYSLHSATTAKDTARRNGTSKLYCLQEPIVLYYGRTAAGGARVGRGPALGGVCLRKRTDFSQTAVVHGARRDSPSSADKALRSTIELAIARRTTSADSESDIVVNVQVRNSGAMWPFFVQGVHRPKTDGVTETSRSST